MPSEWKRLIALWRRRACCHSICKSTGPLAIQATPAVAKGRLYFKDEWIEMEKLNESQANAREILRNNLMNSREGFAQPLPVFCEWPNSQDAPDHTWRSWSHYGSVIWDPEQVPQPSSGASRSSPVHGDAVLGMGQEANAVTDLEVPYTWKALFVCIILNPYFPIRRVPEFPLVVPRVMQLVMNHSGSSEGLQSLSLGSVYRV